MPVIDTAITISFQVRNATNGAPITGDAANLTLKIVADGVDAIPTNSPVEVALGEYKLALTAGENSGEMMSLIGTSSTSNAVVIPARWQNLDASIGSRATPGNLAAIVAMVEIAGGTMTSGDSIELVRGDARTLSVVLTDSAGNPVDLSAYVSGTITLTVKSGRYRAEVNDDNAAFQVTGNITDPAAGEVSFDILPVHSEALTLGEVYDYDIQADDGAGGIATFARGSLKLAFDVTRTSSAMPA